MSTFSEHLNDLIQKKKLTLPYLEKESGLSTALISKIKTGKRLPDSEDKMLKLIQALHCSTEKEKELLKEYRIEKMGRDKYICMEEIRKTVESLSHYSSHLMINRKTEYKFEKSQIVSGENNIKTIIQYLVETELSDSCSFVKILLQPEHLFLENYLVQTISHVGMQNLRLEHIVSLQEPDNDFVKYENIKSAGSCLRLASICGKQYHALYSYKAEMTTEMFPYCILTSQHGLLISANYQHALLVWEKDTLDALNHMYEDVKHKCRPLFQITNDAIGYLQEFDEHVFSSTPPQNTCLHKPLLFSLYPTYHTSRNSSPSHEPGTKEDSLCYELFEAVLDGSFLYPKHFHFFTKGIGTFHADRTMLRASKGVL